MEYKPFPFPKERHLTTPEDTIIADIANAAISLF